MFNRKYLTIAIAVLIYFLAVAAPAFAHRMIIEHHSDTLQVRYDDGTPAQRVTVTVLDEGDRVLWEGQVNEDGAVKPPKGFAKVVATDGLGHRTTYVPGELSAGIPRPVAAALGVSFFLFVASIANYVNKKKEIS